MERQYQATASDAHWSDPATTQAIMDEIDACAFEWAVQAHLRPPGDRAFDRDYVCGQYRILRDHLALGKECVDFIPLRAEFESFTAAELDRSIWEKYRQFCQQLLRETIRAALPTEAGAAPVR